MNDIQRKALGAARKRIERGADNYICVALHKVRDDWWDTPGVDAAVDSLVSFISVTLHNHLTLSMWYESRHGRYLSYAHRRVLRLAWIDWLLGDEDKARATLKTGGFRV